MLGTVTAVCWLWAESCAAIGVAEVGGHSTWHAMRKQPCFGSCYLRATRQEHKVHQEETGTAAFCQETLCRPDLGAVEWYNTVQPVKLDE